MDLDFLKRLSKAIAEQFGENCEVAVHDLLSGDLEHTVAVIENGKVKRQGPKDEILPELLGTSAAANIACEKLGGDR